MTREKEIEILKKDGCTKAEAERHLKRGSIVYSDFEEHFDYYMQEGFYEEEEILKYRRMIDEKIPATDWGIVEDEGKTYYIMYVL